MTWLYSRAMLLIAAFALYAILVRRVRITRNFTLTGSNARVFGFTLLVLLFPMMLAISFVMTRALPPAVLGNQIATRAIGIAGLAVMMVALALIFRDRPSDPSNTAA